MATCAAQARLLSLTMYKSDLEYKLMGITAEKQQLTKMAAEYADMYASMGGTADDFEDDINVKLLQQEEEALEANQAIIESQLQEVNAEKDSISELVKNNIKKDFKINFGS